MSSSHRSASLPTTTPFALPDRLAAKADPALIAADEEHLAGVATSLESQIAELEERLAAERRAPGGGGTEALERDQRIHAYTARLRTLRRFGLDLCLGRIVTDEGVATYIGRVGVTDGDGGSLLIDWRSPAAEPFFAATQAHPMGLASRRRYRWSVGRIVDYWDEAFTDAGAAAGAAALDDQSAFIASLGASRSPQMRDVLGTIAADQDAIVRAPSGGALVVDGGPGTGKTVVALHRAAYLTYTDPRLDGRGGGVLVLGPHEHYVSYTADVLPSLGEDDVRTVTLRDLIPEGATAKPEASAVVAGLKASAAMVTAVDAAVRFYEDPPTERVEVETPWGEALVRKGDWASAFDAARGAPHNEARELIWEELVEIVGSQLDDADPDLLRRTLQRDSDLVAALGGAWPLLEPADVIGDLWSVPAYLRMAAPWLSKEEVAALQRKRPQEWTTSDLPLLDAARQRLGDPGAERVGRRRRDMVARQREDMDRIVGDLIEHDDGDLQIMSMLRGEDLREALVDTSGMPEHRRDALAGPFAHVIVDEAQELTDAEWQMVLRRCPSGSLTIVGDRAQARHGFAEPWEERLERVGLRRVRVSSLGINYRTPAEVMSYAEPGIRAALPDANVPTSIRSTGVPVREGSTAELASVLEGWLAEHEGIACVIGADGFEGSERVRALTPTLAKGLEFDLVVLVDPAALGGGIEGAVDRYVSMTRATQELVVLTA
ncbi:RNA polymerase recycling motor ATPase HelR [Pseudactinotalea suaedae]|uniref:RNA polymerase recycling motor ATPase HelR n=1 Tax=Pseudactinotalea suaedae TaxID=1524924 RepID=UPI0012E0D883|nr:RNA polymerase recycling motor ATPase HelR [Pseudactinotalea suaedae]